MRLVYTLNLLDANEKLLYDNLMQAPGMHRVLTELLREMRDAAKYHDDEGAEKWRIRLWELMDEHHVDIDG